FEADLKVLDRSKSHKSQQAKSRIEQINARTKEVLS
ncbi:MAG: hypothetical protein RI985_2292, partial [Chloroflexota bacterium]